MKDKKAKGMMLTILSAVLFGFSPLLARTVYAAGGNSITLTFFRMMIGSMYMTGLHFITSRESMRITKLEMKKLVICSLGYAVTPLLLLSSYNYIPSGLCTTAHFVYPVFVIVSCIALKSEKVSAIKIICAILCVIGIMSFYTPGGEIHTGGLMMALGSGATYAFYIVYISRSGLLDMAPYKMTAWLNIISAVIAGIFAVASNQIALPRTSTGWIVMGMFALVAGIASITFQLGTKYVGAQSASLLSTFEPLTSVLVGIIVYKEILTRRTLIGIVLILAAVVLVSFAGDKAKET